MPKPARKLPTALRDAIDEQSAISKWRNVVERMGEIEKAMRSENAELRRRVDILTNQVAELLRESLQRSSGIGGADV